MTDDPIKTALRNASGRERRDDEAMMRGMFLTLGQAFALCRMVFPEKTKEWIEETRAKMAKP